MDALSDDLADGRDDPAEVAEIAEVLGVSVAAVKGRIHRARLLLIEELGAWR